MTGTIVSLISAQMVTLFGLAVVTKITQKLSGVRPGPEEGRATTNLCFACHLRGWVSVRIDVTQGREWCERHRSSRCVVTFNHQCWFVVCEVYVKWKEAHELIDVVFFIMYILVAVLCLLFVVYCSLIE